ncbi:MAG: ASCH domain-containing protein [Erysipelotrichales bacterium]|nr:ASCH domain-containing protein [Erysipelotrichales bacterium]
MEHDMKLYNEAFEMIKSKVKTVEMRLNDEKRKKIKVDDVICFQNIETDEKIYVKVLRLIPCKNFDDLYKMFPKTVLGYKNDEVANPRDMLEYYSVEQIEKYGALGIEISLFESDKSLRIHHTKQLLKDFAKDNLSEDIQNEINDILK